MSAPRFWVVAFACLSFLAGCARGPRPRPATPAEVPPPSPPALPAEAPEAGVPEHHPVQRVPTLWESLRNSFAMDDCGSEETRHWGAWFTRHPESFERYLGKVAPEMAYVQARAEQHGVPGEFVLLPWVESRYRHGGTPHHGLAGMWQISRRTGRTMGLAIRKGYDGRMDMVASTDAVMTLIGHYHDWFQDWRLADYAYNAGKYAVEKVVDSSGAPPPTPLVPDLHIRKVTRNHLAQLLGMACVIREPDRFHVTLPVLDPDDRLEPVSVAGGMSLARAARLAGLPVERVREWNAGYRNGRIGRSTASRLLLPHPAAERLRRSLLAGVGPGSSPPAGAPTHTVRSGETLWTIARKYAVEIGQLRAWNGLRGDTIVPGQVLRVGVAD